MEIIFESINGINQDEAKSLRVAQGQEGFIETVGSCLAEADLNLLWQPVLVRIDTHAVAFAMYGLWKDEGSSGRVWLDRFLIDHKFQGKGYSSPILRALFLRIQHEFGYPDIFLSVYDTNTVAVSLYKKMGFDFTGELDINGEKVMVLSVDIT